ncbi:hypothetical protein MsedC_1205 [Metallosphaera sedula]|uniref:Uncharacterized protein n=2 Tax=Metallosphaera TaxID=41980 RepID=A0A0K1SVU0_9CREN|nr:hypothetical protein MsedA_1205 [Metallosphaera sedula]QCO29166.1 hypothetical protein DFR88_00575 [Metallosphaera prunae]AKV76454.1 hypothetical protein MsedB_1207 [Metallosphaera sedula]AKV78706.1 hypothetical protein MsedC_1205 [Metallosphaera sedula]AKV80951.1 hypothetical protein MsedD_1206 [Metallosphaera sedula]
MSAMGVDTDAVEVLVPFCADKEYYLYIKNNGNIEVYINNISIKLPYDRFVAALAPAMFTKLLKVNISEARSDRLSFSYNNNFTVYCSEVLR